ncbi:hypothetical protein [Glutamicibacter sp. NPDC087344]|uniref:hypothetical protein n=1 Tax=Glutamicibacter sp. NPDC087344 TaxID=3363994 RepID=UPI003828A89C
MALKICSTRQYVQRSTLENQFNATWATWLDDDSVLTPKQLQQGIDNSERIANDAIADSFNNREGSK